jgi:hypothetical protein
MKRPKGSPYHMGQIWSLRSLYFEPKFNAVSKLKVRVRLRTGMLLANSRSCSHDIRRAVSRVNSVICVSRLKELRGVKFSYVSFLLKLEYVYLRNGGYRGLPVYGLTSLAPGPKLRLRLANLKDLWLNQMSDLRHVTLGSGVLRCFLCTGRIFWLLPLNAGSELQLFLIYLFR